MRAFVLAASASLAAALPPAPEQLHVYPLTNNSMTGGFTVMWVHQAPLATVQACSPFAKAVNQPADAAQCWDYDVDGFQGTICKARILGVQNGATTQYSVGCDALGFSSNRTLRAPAPDAVRMLAYADAGIAWSNGTMSMLAADAASGRYSAVLNHGDIGYANDYSPASNNSWVWDQYFNVAEPHLDGAAGPHVVICGNHERQHDFYPYLNRTAMPPGGSGPLGRFYSSTAVGPTTVISFSTEHDTSPGSEIHSFVLSALAEASSPAVRAERPWIVVQTHHPMLCTDLLTLQTRCIDEAAQFRQNLEAAFIDASVDIFFSGHNHQLEASWPYRNGTHSTNLHNANGTVYVVNGAAGDIEGIEPFFIDNPGYRMLDSQLSVDTVYARLDVTRTSFAVEFVDSRSGLVTHNFTLTKSA